MKNFKITLNGTQIDSEDVFKYVRRWEIKDAIQYLINETGCTEEEANDVVDEIKDLMKYSLKQSVNKHTHNHPNRYNLHSHKTYLIVLPVTLLTSKRYQSAKR